MPPGKVLTPFGVESFGRLGEAVENLITRLQAVAANRSKLRGGNAGRLTEKLCEEIDAILYRHAAGICHQAEHGLAGVALFTVHARARVRIL